jgi:ribonuclease HII
MSAGKRVIIGIDEAGRGPIVGPMVIAALAFSPESVKELVKLGVKDSKKMSRQQRIKLYERILALSTYAIIVKVPPRLIDYENINRIEENEVTYCIRRVLDAGYRPLRIYVDAVGNPSLFTSRLAMRTGLQRSLIVVEAKADEKYPVVSAASIVAKVTRDNEIERLRKDYGFRGSGYPTDRETLEWILSMYKASPENPPEFIRRTWATLKDIAPGWYVDKRRLLASKSRSLLDFLSKSNS